MAEWIKIAKGAPDHVVRASEIVELRRNETTGNIEGKMRGGNFWLVLHDTHGEPVTELAKLDAALGFSDQA